MQEDPKIKLRLTKIQLQEEVRWAPMNLEVRWAPMNLEANQQLQEEVELQEEARWAPLNIDEEAIRYFGFKTLN